MKGRTTAEKLTVYVREIWQKNTWETMKVWKENETNEKKENKRIKEQHKWFCKKSE